jgi:hypothetical protein
MEIKPMRKSRFKNWRERLYLAVAHLAGVADAVIFFGSFTFYFSNLRADVLFSNFWAEFVGD